MAEKFLKWDVKVHLKTEEDIAAYFDACIEENGNDQEYMEKVLDDIEQARALNNTTN